MQEVNLYLLLLSCGQCLYGIHQLLAYPYIVISKTGIVFFIWTGRKKKAATVFCRYKCTRIINRQSGLLNICVHGNVFNQNKNDLDSEKILSSVRWIMYLSQVSSHSSSEFSYFIMKHKGFQPLDQWLCVIQLWLDLTGSVWYIYTCTSTNSVLTNPG